MGRIRNTRADRQHNNGHISAPSPERAVLVGVRSGSPHSSDSSLSEMSQHDAQRSHTVDFALEESLEELARLSETAGLEVMGHVCPGLT